MLLEHGALLLKAVCRCLTAVWKLCKALELIFVLFLVDIYIHISLLCNLECILHLESMAACHCESGDELIYVSGAVW